LRALSAVKALLATLLVCLATMVLADVAVPQLTGRVVDQTGTLSSSDIAGLTQKLKDLETRKGSQVAVLIVPTTQPETIEQFSIRVAETWKIGRKKVDDGALLVVAKTDRKLRIEEIIETLLALKTRWKLSLIVVEQNLEFITSLSDRILHIQKGRITEELDRESLLAREGQMVPS